MSKQDPTDIKAWDTGDNIAINMRGVTKTFEQWQRGTTFKNIVKNLIKPEKKIITALDNIDFIVKKGEFVAYAGTNGAGKSTTMKLLSGMLIPKSGEISVLNMSPKKDRVKLMNRVGVLFGNRTELWWDHPIAQSFEWKKTVWDIPQKLFDEKKAMVIDMLEIGDIINTFARELSLGQRMRADLALMLLHSPELILLDEPTLGLDVLAKRNIIAFLKKINKEDGVTVIVTSHDMDDLEEMAQRIVLLSHGRIAFDGSFDDLRLHTGAIKIIQLTISDDNTPILRSAALIKSDNMVHRYEVNKGADISQLLGEISKYKNIIDIETGQMPIEEVIANLYETWKGADE